MSESQTAGMFSGRESEGLVLVVDDESDVRKVVRMTLEKSGYDVVEAEDGEKAIEEIKKGEEKKWRKDFKERNAEWTKGLRQDAGLEEAIYILNDMVTMQKGKKLSAVK